MITLYWLIPSRVLINHPRPSTEVTKAIFNKKFEYHWKELVLSLDNGENTRIGRLLLSQMRLPNARITWPNGQMPKHLLTVSRTESKNLIAFEASQTSKAS